MEIAAVKLLTALALPPGVNFLLAVVGLALLGRARRAGIALIVVAAASLWLLSLPVVSNELVLMHVTGAPVDPGDPAVRDADVIVVLTGGRTQAVEYGGLTVSGSTLLRARYAARLHRATGVPLLISGGAVNGEPPTESALARGVLEDELGVPVRWVETRSRNTAENARESVRLIRAEGLERVVLVTHAAHMGRAVAAFAREGMAVTPAPLDFDAGPTDWSDPGGWLPYAWALARSATALHESVGNLWYRLRY